MSAVSSVSPFIVLCLCVAVIFGIFFSDKSGRCELYPLQESLQSALLRQIYCTDFVDSTNAEATLTGLFGQGMLVSAAEGAAGVGEGDLVEAFHCGACGGALLLTVSVSTFGGEESFESVVWHS